jgi:TatA/E family protein of Tat protein translocase
VLNIGVPEMILILVVALLVFGPNRLPEIARSMGKFIRNFQAETNRAIEDLKRGIEPATTGIFDQPDPGTPDEPDTAPVESPPPMEPLASARHATRVTKRSSAPRKKPTAAKKKPATKRKTPPKKTAAARRSPKAG